MNWLCKLGFHYHEVIDKIEQGADKDYKTVCTYKCKYCSNSYLKEEYIPLIIHQRKRDGSEDVVVWE